GKACKARRCPAAQRRRGVTPGTAHCCPQYTRLFLRHHDRVEAPVTQVEREAAKLAERIAYAGEQPSMLLNQEAGTCVASCLLVAQETEHNVARQARALGLPP